MTHKLLALTFVTGLLLTSVSQATLIRYDYRGPNFDTPMPLQSPYEDGDHIEGFITIDDAFLDASGNGNLFANSIFGGQEWLKDFSFTDQVKTITFADLLALDNWTFSLAFSSLDLVSWRIILSISTTVPHNIITRCGTPFAAPDETQAHCGGSAALFGDDSAAHTVGITTSSASVFYLGDPNSPVWNQSIVVPEPTTLMLFTLGLAGLSWAQRRKRRVA